MNDRPDRKRRLFALAAAVVAIVAVSGAVVAMNIGEDDAATQYETEVLESTLAYARSMQSHQLPPDSREAPVPPLPRLGDELASETESRIESIEGLRRTLEEAGTVYTSSTISGHVESIGIDGADDLVHATVMVDERQTSTDGNKSGSNIPYEITYAPDTRSLESVHAVHFPKGPEPRG